MDLSALFPGLAVKADLHNSASSICMIPFVFGQQTFVETMHCSKYLVLKNASLVF